METLTIPVGPLQCNCYVLWHDAGQAVVIDPGDEGPRLISELRRRGLTPTLLLNTHGHFDHTGAVDQVRHAFGATYRAHEAEQEVMRQVPPGTRLWGILVPDPPALDGGLEDGQRFDVGGVRLEARHTPGHTPGSVCFYAPELGAVFTGDTLFQRSVGRSDFPGGDHETLIRSIRTRLLTLPPATRVLPGHGPASTIADEARENPFLA